MNVSIVNIECKVVSGRSSFDIASSLLSTASQLPPTITALRVNTSAPINIHRSESSDTISCGSVNNKGSDNYISDDEDVEKWTMRIDPISKHPFYFSLITRSSTWNKPCDESTILSNDDGLVAEDTSGTDHPWEEVVDLEGRVYYYNKDKHCSQWKHPYGIEGKRSNVIIVSSDSLPPPPPLPSTDAADEREDDAMFVLPSRLASKYKYYIISTHL